MNFQKFQQSMDKKKQNFAYAETQVNKTAICHWSLTSLYHHCESHQNIQAAGAASLVGLLSLPHFKHRFVNKASKLYLLQSRSSQSTKQVGFVYVNLAGG